MNISKVFFYIIILSTCRLFCAKEHETWWEQNLDVTTSMREFASWLGDTQGPSRIALRKHIIEKNYKSILDAACGLGVDFYGLQKDNIKASYQGLDITPKLVDSCKKAGIPACLGSIENIPFNNNTFELVYGRHILEHLDDYKVAISEMIRVAQKEALIIFFNAPTDSKPHDVINCTPFRASKVHWNEYNKTSMENFILQHKKVLKIAWENVQNSGEKMLHIYLSENISQ